MINRTCVKCTICENPLTLRICASGGRQNHLFNCLTCDSQLSYTYHVRDLAKGDVLEEYENCIAVSDAPVDRVINLSSDIPIPKTEIHNRHYSPNIHLMELARNKFEDVRGVADGQAILEYWSDVRTNWDLFNNGKMEVLKKRIQDKLNGGKVEDGFVSQVFSFSKNCHLNGVTSPADEKFVPLIEDLLSSNKEGLHKFLSFHNDFLFKNNFAFYRQALEDVFSNFEDLKQVRLLVKCDADPKDYVISSVHFEASKKLYGNLFEILGKTFSTVPLLVRLKETGAFDSFSSINLDAYLKSSLQNKIDSIPSSSILTIPNEDISNNRIRNASHHNSIFYDKKTQTVLCEDKGQKLELTYLDYLFKCSHLWNYILGQAIVDTELYSFYRDGLFPPSKTRSKEDGTLEQIRAEETSNFYRENSRKVGRNDFCPCGSNRKFKKCHGR